MTKIINMEGTATKTNLCHIVTFARVETSCLQPILNEMGKLRVFRFEFPASSSPILEFPAPENSGELGYVN